MPPKKTAPGITTTTTTTTVTTTHVPEAPAAPPKPRAKPGPKPKPKAAKPTGVAKKAPAKKLTRPPTRSPTPHFESSPPRHFESSPPRHFESSPPRHLESSPPPPHRPKQTARKSTVKKRSPSPEPGFTRTCDTHGGRPIPKTVSPHNTKGNAGRCYWVCVSGCFLGWGDMLGVCPGNPRCPCGLPTREGMGGRYDCANEKFDCGFKTQKHEGSTGPVQDRWKQNDGGRWVKEEREEVRVKPERPDWW